MYALKNKVQLIGHLGNAPEVKLTQNGRKLARFSVATNEVYRNSEGQKIQETQWHSLVAWGKLADIVEGMLHKGKEVAVEGKLVYRTFDDKEGNTRRVTEIIVSELLVIGKAAS